MISFFKPKTLDFLSRWHSFITPSAEVFLLV